MSNCGGGRSRGPSIGRSILRREDRAFLTGQAKFMAEFEHPLLDDAAHVVFVRATIAHANLLSVDTAPAAQASGVIAVITANDHQIWPASSVYPQFYDALFAMPILAEKKVRYVGEPIAAVVAETYVQAVDAAESVVVDYEPLDAVIDINDALNNQVTLFAPENAARLREGAVRSSLPGTNVCMVHETPHDASKFDNADVVMHQRFMNPRQSPSPIETLAQACTWTPDGHLHVWAATQRPHGFREQLCDIFQLDESRVHVTAPSAVGGAFGGKVSRTPEEHALPAISQLVGRPVRWIQTRSEYFQGATQGRGEQFDFQLAGTADGRIQALRADVLKDSGAYPGVGANLPSRYNSLGASGPYDIAHVEFAAVSVVTNTPQTSAFRGAGRGPYLAALERLVDMYAAQIGMDPAQIRRLNLVRAEDMPFTSATGTVYDEADYAGDLDAALRLANYDDLRAEQATLRASGSDTQLGIGIATYHHMTVGGGAEEAKVFITPEGGALVLTGTTSQGHGHDVTWAQIASDVLGIDIDHISVLEGSTELTETGVGAVGSRSMQTAGIAVRNASTGLVDLAREAAATLLEAAIDDIEFDPDGGRFHVAGVPAVAVGWADLAASVHADSRELSCGDIHDVGSNNSFPSGCHVAVVTVDLPTGEVRLRNFFGVDDAGVRINPMIVEGQLHGGIAAGVGQVLGETMTYDTDGNPLTSNFLDYLIPTSDMFPPFVLQASSTPTSFNDLGAKGVGESGIIGSVPAAHNAIVDAISYLGVNHVDLPCSPERIWRAIRNE